MIRVDEKAFDENMKRFRARMLRLVAATRQAAVTGVRTSTVRMRSLARKKAPKAFGKLREGVQERFENDGLTGVVTSTAPYAMWVEGFDSGYTLGRKPGRWPPFDPIYAWVILRRLDIKWKMTPRNATFLVRRKIAKKGTPAQPHIKPAFEVVGPEFNAAMARVFNNAAANAGKLL